MGGPGLGPAERAGHPVRGHSKRPGRSSVRACVCDSGPPPLPSRGGEVRRSARSRGPAGAWAGGRAGPGAVRRSLSFRPMGLSVDASDSRAAALAVGGDLRCRGGGRAMGLGWPRWVGRDRRRLAARWGPRSGPARRRAAAGSAAGLRVEGGAGSTADGGGTGLFCHGGCGADGVGVSEGVGLGRARRLGRPGRRTARLDRPPSP